MKRELTSKGLNKMNLCKNAYVGPNQIKEEVKITSDVFTPDALSNGIIDFSVPISFD